MVTLDNSLLLIGEAKDLSFAIVHRLFRSGHMGTRPPGIAGGTVFTNCMWDAKHVH